MGRAATLLQQTRTKRRRCYRVNSIKWDYWQNVGAARDEYATAQLEMRSLSPKATAYRVLAARVDSLREALIARSVAFICDASRMDTPLMWSALHLSMLDMEKISVNNWRDNVGDTVLRYLLRALTWDRKPISDNSRLFTCDDFHMYVNLSSRLDAEQRFVHGLCTIISLLDNRGGMAERNAAAITRLLVGAAAKTGDDRGMWAYVQQFRYDDDNKDSIEEHIFSNPSEQASSRALLARIRLRSEPDIATILCPAIGAASTSRLIEAAGRWRNEITARASDGNTLWESDARIAHALVCCELAGRNHITASDLAELIETMSGKRTFHDLMLNTPYGRQHVYDTETLIDAVCPQMTS